MKLALVFLLSLPLFGQGFGGGFTPAPSTAGGTCAGLAGDVTGTCAANSIKSSVGLTGAPTAPTGAVGDASTQIANDAALANALASINPAVSVQAATVGVLSNTPTYNNGTAGVGATLTAGSNGALTIDGYVVLLNDRVLVKNQASALQNGAYTLTTLGTGGVPYVLTRATDYNSTTNINYTGTIPVIQGSTLANTGWNLTTQIATLGTDSLSYTQAAAGSSGGPPGGNVKATGNLGTGNVITGAGGKTIQDSAVAFSAIPRIVASGTSTLGTGSISANSCASTVTTTATGAASTSRIVANANADISSVTGFGFLSTDGLKIYAWPTTNNVNFHVCNGTGSPITPGGAVTLNWMVF